MERIPSSYLHWAIAIAALLVLLIEFLYPGAICPIFFPGCLKP